MTGYDINQAVEDLIDAAILRDLATAPELNGFVHTGPAYVRDNPATGNRVVLPGRQGVPASLGPELRTSVLDPATTIAHGMPVSQLFAKWENRIYPMFHPYKTMPLPEAFQGSINAFQPVLQKLAIDPETYPGVESGDPRYLGFKVDGNEAFTVIESASAQFALMQGQTAEGFRKYYLDRFPLITQRQYGLVWMIRAAVVGEQLLWQKLQPDVSRLLTEAVKAFTPGSLSSADVPFEVIQTVLDLVSLFPPAAPVVGQVKTIVGMFARIPALNKEEKPTYRIEGHDVEALWASLQRAVRKMDSVAADQEEAIAQHMDRLHGALGEDPGAFDLGRIDDPNDADTTSEGEELATEADASSVVSDKGVMNLDFKVMHDTGGDLRAVAPVFRQAAGELDQVLTNGPWVRDGDIGRGYDGHYQETRSLADALVTILLDTARGLERGGDVVQIAARRIKGEDDQADAALSRHKREVERSEAAEANSGN